MRVSKKYEQRRKKCREEETQKNIMQNIFIS
jgi:hypothetical protein